VFIPKWVISIGEFSKTAEDANAGAKSKVYRHKVVIEIAVETWRNCKPLILMLSLLV